MNPTIVVGGNPEFLAAVTRARDLYMPAAEIVVAVTGSDLDGPAKPDPKPIKKPKGGKK